MTDRPTITTDCSRIGALALLHLTGVATTTVTLAWLALGTDHIRWLLAAHRAVGDASMVAPQLALHLGLSAFLWALGYLIFSGVARRERPARGLRRARGTVLTETLIVMPVLLLLILGTAQLSVNNIAGMLINYGTSQAARTAWVWQPEIDPIGGEGEGRMGVDQDWVEEMATLRIAAAMTPVAPSMFASQRDIASDEFEQMRAIFLATQLRHAPIDAGDTVLGDAQALDAFEEAQDLLFKNALDGGTFPRRTVRKFTSAYEATEVTIIDQEIDGGRFVGVEVEYMHQITFPLVGGVFGQSAQVGQTRSRFLSMQREMTYRAQRSPNAQLPPQ